MSILSPEFALLLLGAIPIILLYMLKLQREKVEVSSILLWQMVLRDRQANRLWQKLKRNLLMVLQLAILVTLVAALIQPAFPWDTISNAQVIVILDGSASMQASDGSPSRFDAAKSEIRSIIDDLPPDSELTLIQANSEPSVLVAHSQDKLEMREALESAVVSYAEPNWGAVIDFSDPPNFPPAERAAPTITTSLIKCLLYIF